MSDSPASTLGQAADRWADPAGVDERRRRMLLATCAAGGAASGAALWPFLASLEPSERAKAFGAPVEVDIGPLEPGRMITVEWRGQPAWILHRTKAMLAGLAEDGAKLADPASKNSIQPAYARNAWRSIKPEYLVVVGICTHLGCVPTPRFEPGDPGLGRDWPGGFQCPCHGSRFDLAARVYANMPAPTNLTVPPYKYLSGTRIVIGEDTA